MDEVFRCFLGRFSHIENGQQNLRVFGGVEPQAGQITAVWLVDQAFVMQALGSGNRRGGGSVVNLDSFLRGAQVKQREDFQFGNQLRGKGHKYSSFLF